MVFAYDPFGKLVQSTDDVGNVVSATYDTRGRKIATSDPDMGAWSYSYDVLGQLTSQTDAKAQTVTQIYDKLGRTLRRAEPAMTPPWGYDTATNSNRKLPSPTITPGPSPGVARTV